MICIRITYLDKPVFQNLGFWGCFKCVFQGWMNKTMVMLPENALIFQRMQNEQYPVDMYMNMSTYFHLGFRILIFNFRLIILTLEQISISNTSSFHKKYNMAGRTIFFDKMFKYKGRSGLQILNKSTKLKIGTYLGKKMFQPLGKIRKQVHICFLQYSSPKLSSVLFLSLQPKLYIPSTYSKH